MKILNIFFKNINSLEGESQIHFDRPPLVDGGVFAITGPNGSGKSSILDAITLALYGETFRFDRPADHVMTKSTAESFAQIEFSLGTDIFRSSWHVKRENEDSTGALLPSEMKLVQLNGSEQVLEESTQKVRDRMTELTGMDFHKFSKSMVLAQGDFAAFLNSLDSERMDILEKISGTDIYEEYKKQAEEENTQAQLRLQKLEEDLIAIPVMDNVTREAHEQDLEDFKEQQVELEGEHEEVQQQLFWVQKTINLEDQLETLDNQQQLVQSQLEENQKQLEKIDASQDMMRFEEELMHIDSKVEEAQQSKKTLDSYRSESEMLQKQLQSSGFDEKSPVTSKTLTEQKSSIDQLKLEISELKFHLPQERTLVQSLNQQIEEKKSVLTVTESWLQEHAVDESLLENFPQTEKLTNLKAKLLDLAEKQKAYAMGSKTITEGLKKNKSDISLLNKKNSDLIDQIEADEKLLELISEGYSLQDLQEMKAEQQRRVNDFQELNDLSQVNSKLGKKGFIYRLFGSESENKEEIQLTQEADQLQMEIGREQNLAQTLELAVFNEMLLQKMQVDREHLIDGKPCPLCGALEHPYSKFPPAISNSKQLLTDQRVKVTRLKVDAKNLTNQIAVIQKQTEKDDNKESQLQVICSQWNTLANRLNIASVGMDINKLSEIKDLLKAEKAELFNLDGLIKQLSKQQSSISLAKSSIETNKTVLIRLNKEVEELDLESHSRPDESNDLEQAYVKCQLEEQALSKKVLEQLSFVGEEMPAKKAKEEALNVRLNDRRQEYQRQMMDQKAFAEEIKELEEKVVGSLTKIDGINQDIEQNTGLVQQEETAGLHLSLTEKQKLIAEKEGVFSQQETELVAIKQNLLDKINDTEDGDLNGLRETIALIKRQPDIQQKRLELTQSVSEIENNLKHSQSQLEILQAEELTKKTEEELLVLEKSSQVKLDIAKQEVESLQNKLNEQNSLQEKYEHILAKVSNQKAEAETSAAEIKLISDNNGVHFRRKVQQEMADKLLSQTNKILEKISGRYYLRKVESEHGLALEIEDTRQQNVRRLPKTLSGGESFIVSLALALGLAEMAKNGHAVDSLFLDEGFGNLDAESLYLVMTTLESLKTHGKVVGVISHVEGVRKRIKTQIEMIKKPNGLSALKMVS